jgi:hypothetical protein
MVKRGERVPLVALRDLSRLDRLDPPQRQAVVPFDTMQFIPLPSTSTSPCLKRPDSDVGELAR